MSKINVTNPEDRRRFFRIDDAVNLYYRIVDEQTVLAVNDTNSDVLSSCSLVTALEVLGQESRIALYKIEKKDADIAEYLRIIDSKIELLSKVVLQYNQESSEATLCKTNMSASGLAIEVDKQIAEGEFIEVKLFLSSCIAVVLLYGKVIYCRKSEQESGTLPYQIGIDYINLKDEDREILIKHIVKRQMQQIRENKQES